jgi:hypothetical protein
MSPAERGAFEVRRHMVDGVVGVWWTEPGQIDALVFVTGEPEIRLAMLANVLAKWLAEHRRPSAPAPREPVTVASDRRPPGVGSDPRPGYPDRARDDEERER